MANNTGIRNAFGSIVIKNVLVLYRIAVFKVSHFTQHHSFKSGHTRGKQERFCKKSGLTTY
jgi:hypothetical protein